MGSVALIVVLAAKTFAFQYSTAVQLNKGPAHYWSVAAGWVNASLFLSLKPVSGI